MIATDAHSAPGNAAMTAFLRGIERRGFVLAQAQCGDPVRAQAAIDAAAHDFCAQAGALALTAWPAFFWQRLLAQPVLRETSRTPVDPLLARLGAGPRAVLLLRLVAGLDPAHGAQVLRISPDAYRHALYRALHELHACGVTDADLRVFREALQQRARSLPEPTLRLPEPSPFAPARSSRSMRAPHLLRPVLSGLLALALAGLAASYFWKPRNAASTGLAAQAPAATLTQAADLIASPDFALLGDADGARISRDLDLYSWYAAGAEAATPSQSDSSLPESATPETAAPDADGDAHGN